ncbi:MAG: CBS domain-containing protein [Lachnospiraceae bacterium]
MNVLFFLTPKSEVTYVQDNFTIRQAMEKMSYHRYSAVPMIDHEGHYVGTLTEGDLLWGLKDSIIQNKCDLVEKKITTVPRRMDNKAVRISADVKEVVIQSMNQNFVPVVDDQNIFIGIVTRKDILNYFYKKYFKAQLDQAV